ncbi:glycosyltransferase family 4 protein [Mucilaginibacter sp.]|uniref:glycosyltransferase family 4 protein n=1 Tax=Mucilaginibacter sp. TaxID=1882438 RepID=UPI002620EDEF|nr:glycosyltransferase family 4 protein [Mucilaginibacter sp.]MDB4925325.1 glycosyltransferase [Mucilaginibacter sp.]
MSVEILSTAIDLDLYGGQEKVLMDIHEGIKNEYNAKVLGFIKYDKLHPKYKISKSEYIRLKNPLHLNNKIIIVHGRNAMTILMILKRVFFLNTRFLYVHHNVYNSLKRVSFFPDNIISISGKVTENLINYFGLKKRNIQLIYNGIKQATAADVTVTTTKKDKIKIVYAARVNGVKRQLEIVERLGNKLSPKIEIHFAGTGPDYEKLKDKCSHTNNFFALGFVDNTNELIANSDYLMLYSKQEGLPISLIEGTLYGKPLLVNDVGGNAEIGIPGVNGILLNNDWDDLANTLNSLVDIPEDEYLRMGKNSRKRYEAMFTYDKMIADYINKIKQISAN